MASREIVAAPARAAGAGRPVERTPPSLPELPAVVP